jgi:putative transcriptional regulator
MLIFNISLNEMLNQFFMLNRIKEVLESKGIKQTWLAEKLEKSYNMVNSYAKKRRQPSLEDLFKIAKILDVAVAELLEMNNSKRAYGTTGYSIDTDPPF